MPRYRGADVSSSPDEFVCTMGDGARAWVCAMLFGLAPVAGRKVQLPQVLMWIVDTAVGSSCSSKSTRVTILS